MRMWYFILVGLAVSVETYWEQRYKETELPTERDLWKPKRAGRFDIAHAANCSGPTCPFPSFSPLFPSLWFFFFPLKTPCIQTPFRKTDSIFHGHTLTNCWAPSSYLLSVPANQIERLRHAHGHVWIRTTLQDVYNSLRGAAVQTLQRFPRVSVLPGCRVCRGRDLGSKLGTVGSIEYWVRLWHRIHTLWAQELKLE